MRPGDFQRKLARLAEMTRAVGQRLAGAERELAELRRQVQLDEEPIAAAAGSAEEEDPRGELVVGSGRGAEVTHATGTTGNRDAAHGKVAFK